jgi:A/G-specific adenine glycosylase
MDIGATVCRPTPDCAACPLSAHCRWFSGGGADLDPAIGSAGVSGRQAPFAGSDREARGALLRAVADTARPRCEFRADIVEGLLADGLVVCDDAGLLSLP